MKKQKKPLIFLQGHGTYTNETIVAIGAAGKDIVKFAKKIGVKSEIQEWLEKSLTGDNKLVREGDQGFILTHDNGATVLSIRKYERGWKFWEVLVHEICHLVDFVLRNNKLMEREMEACAYQSEFLFREIGFRVREYYDKK